MSSILTIDDEDKDHTTNKSSFLPLNKDEECPDDSGGHCGGRGVVAHVPLSSAPSREDEFTVPSEAAAQECAMQTEVKAAEKEITIASVEQAAVEAALPLPLPIQPLQNHDDKNDNTTRRRYCWSLPRPPVLPEALQGALSIEDWNAFWTNIMTFVRRKRACDFFVFLVVVAILVGVERMGRESPNVAFWIALPLALVVAVVGTMRYKWRQQDRFYEHCRELDQRLFVPHGLSLTVSTREKDGDVTTILTIVQPGAVSADDGTTTTDSAATFNYSSTVKLCCGYNVWIVS